MLQRAHNAAEQQGGSSALAQGIMAAVPEAEAEVIRAELDKIKLSGGCCERWLACPLHCWMLAQLAPGMAGWLPVKGLLIVDC